MLNSEIQKLIRKIVTVADNNGITQLDVEKALADAFSKNEREKKILAYEIAIFKVRNMRIINRIEAFVRNELYPLRNKHESILCQLSEEELGIIEMALIVYYKMAKSGKRVEMNKWFQAVADELKIDFKVAKRIINEKLKLYMGFYECVCSQNTRIDVIMRYFYRCVMMNW